MAVGTWCPDSRSDASEAFRRRRRPRQTPFTVRKEPHHPLYTFDCCWFCGVDILRAESKRAVGKTTIPYRDCVRNVETNLDATVYELNEKTPEGAHLRGHMAIADYHGGWVVWAGDDIDYEKE